MSKRLDLNQHEPARLPRLSRRGALGLAGAGLAALGFGGMPVSAFAQVSELDVLAESAVLRDPDVPVAGNPDGDITIVEFSDFQCPYCRKVAPDLRAAVKEDGKVRLVHKDWPILGAVSIYAARIAIAARFQNKFIEAHDALIAADSKLTEASVRERLAAAGIDVDRAVADVAAHKAEIDALLRRNNDQASAFGFNGTPAFIIGKFRVPGPLSKEHFALAIADARKANSAK